MSTRDQAQVIRHQSPLGDWELVLAQPHPRLRPFVREYQGYIERAASFEKRRELPSATLPLIINFGPPIRLFDSANPSRFREVTSFTAGLHESYSLVGGTGPWHGLQINITPIGAYRLFGVPMEALANRVVPLDDLLGRDGDELVAALYDASSWEARFAILDDRLTARIDRARLPSAKAMWVWRRLRATDGRVDVGRLVREIGCSPRHLIAECRECLGLPPKTIARILRFAAVVRRYGTATSPRWAEIAEEAGYYDQAHFIHEFRHFAVITPQEFVTLRLPDHGGILGD